VLEHQNVARKGSMLRGAHAVVTTQSLPVSPSLAGTVVTATVIFQVFCKLVGSLLYQLKRLVRWTVRHSCLVCCYRVEEDPAGHARLVWCGRRRTYYELGETGVVVVHSGAYAC
jgi:hypothetical protein